MHHQESSCLDVLTLASQISCTLMTWSLPSHRLTSRPPSMQSLTGAFDSASDLVLVPPNQRLWCSGPDAALQRCHVQLGGVSLPVMWSYKYLGVVLSPTLSWSKHLVSRGKRFFAQCVSWCRVQHLPVHMTSSILCVHVLPSVLRSSEFFAQSPTALRLVRGWPAGSTCAGSL